MPASSSAASEALDALLRPLRFAERNGFRNLSVLRGLEATLRAGLERAAPGLEPERHARAAALIEGLEGAADRERRVRALLALLGSGPAGSGPAAPGAAPGAVTGTARSVSSSEPRARGASATEPRPDRGPAGGRGAKPARVAPSPKAPPSAEPESGRRKRLRLPAEATADPLARRSLSEIRGVGPKVAEKLADKGLSSVLDALLLLPRAYEDRRRTVPIPELVPGRFAVVEGTVLQAAVTGGGRGKRVLEVVIGADGGTLSLRWFRYGEAMKRKLTRGTPVTAAGVVTAWGAMRQMVHPDLDAGSGEAEILPVYPDIGAVPARTLRKIVLAAVDRHVHEVLDPVPEALRARRGLPALPEALRHAHRPSGLDEEAGPDALARRRLAFDELLYYQLVLALKARDRAAEDGLVNAPATPWREIAAPMLPFALTRAQARVLDELYADLGAARPMNRLLQGDVGSGKTAVAMVAAALVAEVGRQVALLAPTEILAEQHAANAHRFLAARGLRYALLTGSTRAAERRSILGRLAAGALDVLIGTHAILEPDVVFAGLGLSIVDEQHRFGVEQRATLRDKARGVAPDVLVMTATPIPRTLSMTLYGDLAVSVLDELPPGRAPIRTRALREGERAEAHAAIDAALSRGEQAYVVYPLVETSEQLDLRAATDAVVELGERFAPHAVGLLHGRMRPDEKQAVMDAFRRGEIAVLVSTTVIEVGVDVPNATVMVLEHAERFGLGQIHQLRGRVGRGDKRGECHLVVGGGGREAWSRLAVLEETTDGFRVAEADLELRGPGELLGTRQSGLPQLMSADLVRDADLLDAAREEAFALLAADPRLEAGEHRGLVAELRRRMAGQLRLAEVG